MKFNSMIANETNCFSKPNQTILFVDDEADILKALKRELRSEPYQQHFAQSGQEALDLLAQTSIHVLISDMRMPHMDGVALLENVATRYPDIIRIVISGWADADSILDAINNGHIYRYIVKPWDARELKVTLRQALKMYRLQAERKEMLEQLHARNLHLERTVAKRTEQIMAVSQQAELGRYASKIVQKLNDPISTLSTTVELMGLMASRDTLNPEQLKKEVITAQSGIDRLKQIVAGIGGRASEEKIAQVNLVNLNKLIQEEMEYFDLDPFFRYEVQKELRLIPNIPEIMGNPVKIKQILNKFIKNAGEAMAATAEKKLIIETLLQGNFIVIRISDTGVGIAPENQNRIFLDDFTTKPIEKNVGLGLAAAKSMLKAYSGSIDFTSTLNKGTTFRINFPIGRPLVR